MHLRDTTGRTMGSDSLPAMNTRARILIAVIAIAGCGDDGDAGSGASGSSEGSSSSTSATAGMTSATGSTTASATSTTEATSTTTDTTDSSSTGSFVCDGPNICVPATPAQWEGPFAVARQDAAQPAYACSAPFDTEAGTLFDDLQGGSHQCSCDCGDPVGAACGNQVTLERYGNTSLCLGNPLETFPVSVVTVMGVPVNPCNNNLDTAASQGFRFDPLEVEGGSCTAMPTETIDTAQFDLRVTLCGTQPVAAAGCDDGELCTARPPTDVDTQVCVARDGEHACPDGYPLSDTVYREFDDTRSCSTCSCGAPTGDCTGYNVVLFAENACSGLGTATIVPNTCEQSSNQPTQSGRLSAVPTLENAECAPAQPQPAELGGLSPQGPVTVCCRDLEGA